MTELSGERIAVTGAGGFIGLAVCARLAAAGAAVVGLDRDASAAVRVTAGGAAFALGDTTDPATLHAAFADCSGVISPSPRPGSANVPAASARTGRIVHGSDRGP